jgi:hypothetical protein
MPVILVIIIAVAWIAILAPNMMRRRARLGDGVSSISNFHHQLRILEHSAPEPLVVPAYRLLDGGAACGSDPDHADEIVQPILTVVGEDQLPRPALAFLGRDEEGPPIPAPPAPVPEMTLPRRPSSSARRAIRRRRRDTLGILTGVFTTTLLIGFIPGASAAWMLSAISGVALVAYAALLVRLHKVEYDQSRKLRYLRGGVPPSAGWSVEGDDGEVVRSGRFAHPSHPVWAAR